MHVHVSQARHQEGAGAIDHVGTGRDGQDIGTANGHNPRPLHQDGLIRQDLGMGHGDEIYVDKGDRVGRFLRAACRDEADQGD
jgi:hypothetical protein